MNLEAFELKVGERVGDRAGQRIKAITWVGIASISVICHLGIFTLATATNLRDVELRTARMDTDLTRLVIASK